MPAETYGSWQARMAILTEHERHARNGTDPQPDCPSCHHSLNHPARRASRYPVLATDLTQLDKAKSVDDD